LGVIGERAGDGDALLLATAPEDCDSETYLDKAN
jgi:hypothetical protein